MKHLIFNLFLLVLRMLFHFILNTSHKIFEITKIWIKKILKLFLKYEYLYIFIQFLIIFISDLTNINISLKKIYL